MRCRAQGRPKPTVASRRAAAETQPSVPPSRVARRRSRSIAAAHCPPEHRPQSSGLEIGGMLSEYLAHCEDAGSRLEGGSARTGGKRAVEPVEASRRERNVASPQGFERRIQLRPQIRGARDAAKLDNPGTNG